MTGQNPPIVICDCDHRDVDSERAVLAAAGLETRWLHCRSPQQVVEQCQGAVCLINQYVRLDESVFRGIPSLRMIARYGVGLDNVDMEAAERYGIQVTNVPDYGTREVADHALGLLLCLTRRLPQLAADTAAGHWDYTRAVPVHRLSDCTVGILGLGRIGLAFAQRVHALGCRVIGTNGPRGLGGRSLPPWLEYTGDADRVLREADILSVHAALNEGSRAMLDGAAFARMKKGAYFINVSRGGLVDEAALARALDSGQLAGAAVDVAVQEPPAADWPLRSARNILITPHAAWYSEEAARELKRKAAEEAVRFYKGEPLHYPVNHPAHPR